MGLSIRFYLFAEDGFQAISQRVMMGLIRGKDAMPQYAGTRQKVADVILESEGKKPARIERTQGSYLTFDENGLDEVGEGRVRPIAFRFRPCNATDQLHPTKR
ncbi:hypothetical protein EDE08_113195 [Bradyrhizobium sp. R2.2-H]|jgi:hypothetical protein|uniref:hypothetical protein n=1 Tax=unclassified Bradyrhizobium TaxID=2631580 RepID=UPI00104A0025|nr:MULTISPECIES: hypothetical protein [unclassified Bradyrhizobium]TCU65581.1 hypothetical protein EDE10_113195 [Bradyrhizobium sp. Y-H1]TCU67728.1 hypothetical protein EDE08_113195 [Bradyrhizobium sp. R2.2-H]